MKMPLADDQINMADLVPSSLPPIDAVEVVDLAKVRAKKPGEYMAAAGKAKFVRLTGADAERIADLWRLLPAGRAAPCHIAPFGLRFFAGGQVVCEASLSWQCHSIFATVNGEQQSYEFDGFSTLARDLLAVCKRQFEPAKS